MSFIFVRVIQVECVVIMLAVYYPLSSPPPTKLSSSQKTIIQALNQ